MYEAYLEGRWVALAADNLADAQAAAKSLRASRVRKVVTDPEADNEEGRQDALSAGCDYGEDA